MNSKKELVFCVACTNLFVQIVKKYSIQEFFKAAVLFCKDVDSTKYPRLFISSHDATTKNKKQDLFNQLNKIHSNQMMTFVVRLHYAHHLMNQLYGAKSKFDFKTYPILIRVFDAIEREMNVAWRRINKSSKDSSTELTDVVAASPGGEETVDDELSTVVNNMVMALQNFEKFVRSMKK